MNYLYDSRFNNELINMIYDSDAGVRIRVIKSIRHNRVENTQQLIRNAAANDPNGRVRFAAINFLLDISDPSLINILAKAINESDEITRLSAVNVFYRLNSTRGAPVLCTRLRFEDSNEIKEIMLDSLIRCESVPYTDGVIKILRGDDDSSLRVKAAYLLGLRRDAQTMYALIDGLKDTQDTVRAEAASSLGNYQMIQATEALLAAIAENKNRYVRSAALYAITKSKTRGATVGLFDIFSFEEDPVFRSQLYKTVRDLIVKYH
jgi:HEAT repeat protein